MAKEDYTLRRVLHYMMVVARSLKTLSSKECDYPAREAAKCGALISLRALSVFLTDDHSLRKDGSRVYPDDVLITDFNLPKGSGLSSSDRDRINKLVAHAVNVKQKVYRDAEVCAIAPPILEECAKFMQDCRQQRLAKLTGRAPKYLGIIAGLSPSLRLPKPDQW